MSYHRAIFKDTGLLRHSGRTGVFGRHPKMKGVALALVGLAAAGARWGSPDLPGFDTNEASALAPMEHIGGLPDTTPPTATHVLTTARLPFEPRVPVEMAETATADGDDEQSARYPGTAWRNVTIQPGDNLPLVFNRVGANRQDMQSILDIDAQTHTALAALSPGQVLRFRLGKEQHVEELVFEQDVLRSVRFGRSGQRFKADWQKTTPEVRIASAVAKINHSLFIDGQKAGLTDKTIMQFINIFGWDVDFVRDLQRGDQFSVVFEELYKNGKKFTNGRILAAEFLNRGKRLRTFYYDNNKGVAGYFSERGDAMRKAFLRTPVNFTRISSRFSLAREHPILNTIRAHKGVDYAAPMGTLIQSVADGTVLFVGWKGGYGNVIQLKHGPTYSTLYGHMSKVAQGLTAGGHVSQGQVIGYVGRTGLATGPHLHFEFLINGTHYDPLLVKLPNSLPLERQYMADFRKQSTTLLTRLDSLHERNEEDDNRTMVAKADDSHRARRDAVNN